MLRRRAAKAAGAVKAVVNAIVLGGLTLAGALIGGYVAHGLWLVFLVGWEALD